MSRLRPRPRVWVLLSVLAVGLLVVSQVRSPEGARTTVPTSGVFAADSPFNAVIPAGPALDANSDAMASYATADGVHANLVRFAIPVFESDDGTPRVSVRCEEPASWGAVRWPASRVPIPSRARPHAGSDGAMVVIDRAHDKVYEFWRARRIDGGWTTAWGSISTLSGSGWSSTATGSGASRLGGVIRMAELQSGVIPHALVMQSSNTCAGVVRKPATKTDGASTRSDCLPEGARLQLDPDIDVTALEGLTRADRAMAVALQTYGAYVIDSGGARLSISFELAPDAAGKSPGSVYSTAGLPWDYIKLNKIPWSRMRVLSSWTGTL